VAEQLAVVVDVVGIVVGLLGALAVREPFGVIKLHINSISIQFLLIDFSNFYLKKMIKWN